VFVLAFVKFTIGRGEIPHMSLDLTGNELRAARTRLGLAPRDLAALAGVSEWSVRALERNGLSGNFDTVLRVLNVLEARGALILEIEFAPRSLQEPPGAAA
jgi:predicted transcriptional regulator